MKLCHLGFLSLGNFDIRFSHFHVHNLSPVAGVDLPSPPPYFPINHIKMWLLSHYTKGGASSLTTWVQLAFWRPKFGPFLRRFRDFHSSSSLMWCKNPIFGTNWSPEVDLTWFSASAKFRLSGDICHPPSDPLAKKLSQNLHFGVAFSKNFLLAVKPFLPLVKPLLSNLSFSHRPRLLGELGKNKIMGGIPYPRSSWPSFIF